MSKLNQIIAVEKGIKARANQAVTEVYHTIQKTEPLKGIARTYCPKDEEGERLPSETTRVQMSCNDLLKKAQDNFSELFDIVATKDWGNCQAKADLVVNGEVILPDVPVTYLLFLEKQLMDIRTLLSKMPTLDPTESWKFDDVQNCYASDPRQTTKTKKIPRNHVKAEATDKHPAQVEVYHEDIVVGTWTTVQYSGAMPAKRVAELTLRVEQMQAAVKFAREAANSAEVTQQRVGAFVLGYLFR